MLEGRIFTSITDIAPQDWNACFLGDLEAYAYHLAIERAGLPGFSYFYIGVFDGEDLVGIAPAFTTPYNLETTLDQPALRRFIQIMKKPCPGFLRVSLAALGSPCTERAMLGIKDQARNYGIVDCLLNAFESEALKQGATLLAVKDLARDTDGVWTNCLLDLGYGLIPGLPSTRLDVDFDTLDGYLARLSSGTRKDMRRKLKTRSALRVENVSSLKSYEAQVMALYKATLERADMALEELTFAFFENVLTLMPEQALCRLYFDGDTLVALNLLLHNDSELFDKYFLMAPEGRRLNLYFVSWFDNLAFCLNEGLRLFHTGQAAYENKVRLGARLDETYMAFKHRNMAISGLFRLLSPLFAGDTSSGAIPHA